MEPCLENGNPYNFSEKGWKSPDKYTDVPDMLAEKGVIPEDHKGKLRKKYCIS